ncbi:MAG: PAS domain-containing protein, partial [Planctomycetes bacterium]|nr:PAS domain-containing protein [Planctomycetota bacterium]
MSETQDGKSMSLRIAFVALRDSSTARSLRDLAREFGHSLIELDSTAALNKDVVGSIDVVFLGVVDEHNPGAKEANALLSRLGSTTLCVAVIADSGEAAASELIDSGIDDYLRESVTPKRAALYLRMISARVRRRLELERAKQANEYLLRAIPDLVFVIGRDGTYYEAISAREGNKLFVVEPEALIGNKVSDYFPAEQSQAILDAIAEVLDTRKNVVLTYALTLHGELRWFAGHGAPIDDQTKDRCIWVARDITHRREVEMRASETASLLRAVLDTLPLGIFWKDRDGRFLGMNAYTAKAINAESVEAAIGKTDFDFPNTRDHAEHYLAYDRQVM